MRLFAILLIALPLAADCRLPEVAPDAISVMTPRQLVESGHYRRAVELLDPVVKEHPEDGQAAWLLSRAKASLGELDLALTLADAALATDDANPAYHEQVALVAGKMAQGAGLLKQLTLVRRAKKELDAAAALDPTHPPAQFGLMMFYYAAPSLVGGDKARAKQIGEQVAQTNPTGPYYLGRLAVESKDYVAAETYYKQSLETDPQRFDTLAALAKLYEENLADPAKAEDMACRAVQSEPTRGDAWALLARAYSMCGCWTQVADILTRSSQADPVNRMPYYSAAAGMIERGENLELAASHLAQYASQPPEGDAPNEAQVHWQLGLLREKQGDAPSAVTELRIATASDPALEAAKADLKRVTAEAKH